MPYTGLAAKTFSDNEVIVGLSQQIADKLILNDHFSDQVSFQFFETEPQTSVFADVCESRRWLAQQIKQCQPDAVAVPPGDGMALKTGLDFLQPTMSQSVCNRVGVLQSLGHRQLNC